MQHEAGHFLIAYLLGVLPKGYTLSSLEAFIKERSLNVQAGTAFVDFEFAEEVNFLILSSLIVPSFYFTCNFCRFLVCQIRKFSQSLFIEIEIKRQE